MTQTTNKFKECLIKREKDCFAISAKTGLNKACSSNVISRVAK
jgi:hypothetical protein